MTISVIDSHTGGEPTRAVIDSELTPPEPGALAARDFLSREHDWLRRALILEPRGFEAIVGAYLCKPTDQTSTEPSEWSPYSPTPEKFPSEFTVSKLLPEWSPQP
jgi:proline racemase